MGSVYIANQHPIDRKVAVKVLLGKLAEDEVAVKRFEQEAKAISRMQHPNTVTIYDFGKTGEETGERLYIVMEYLRGRTLTQVLRADGQLEPHRVARIMRQVCASLADAHTAGIIHRDLKPDNIFLTEVGGDKDWVKVLDFGVAKLADSEGGGHVDADGHDLRNAEVHVPRAGRRSTDRLSGRHLRARRRAVRAAGRSTAVRGRHPGGPPSEAHLGTPAGFRADPPRPRDRSADRGDHDEGAREAARSSAPDRLRARSGARIVRTSGIGIDSGPGFEHAGHRPFRAADGSQRRSAGPNDAPRPCAAGPSALRAVARRARGAGPESPDRSRRGPEPATPRMPRRHMRTRKPPTWAFRVGRSRG